MKLNSISGLTCYVKDLEKSAEFYESLGFRIGKQEEDRVTCYVNWFGVELVAEDKEQDPELKKEAKLPNKGAGAFLYVKVDDLDEYYEAVRSMGMEPVGEPVKRPSGNREFILRDLDGYKLIFFEKK